MDAPRSHNLHQYIKECKRHNVTDVVRVCEPTYSAADLTKAGIQLHEMPYPDGHSPPDDVLDRWLKLVDERFIHPVDINLPIASGSSSLGASLNAGGTSATASASAHGNANGNGNGTTHTADSDNLINTTNNNTKTKTNSSTTTTIAVHCVAGLGRAPVLVAIALIEFCQMEPVDAALFIRRHRRGAINNTQLDWLEQYKRRYKGSHDKCCIVM